MFTSRSRFNAPRPLENSVIAYSFKISIILLKEGYVYLHCAINLNVIFSLPSYSWQIAYIKAWSNAEKLRDDRQNVRMNVKWVAGPCNKWVVFRTLPHN